MYRSPAKEPEGENALLRFGVGILSQGCNEFVDLAGRVEEWGYDQIWVPDQRFCRDVYVTLASCALSTRKIRLGTAVTDPYIRFPILTAVAIATIDELSNGRSVLGLGSGKSGFDALGIDPRRPVVAIRETVQVIRRLIAGETVDYDGETIKLNNASLGFRPMRNKIPIYIAARGPKILEMSGEIADGVILAVGSTVGVRYAMEQIGVGADRAERNKDEIDVVSWTNCSIADDSLTAKNMMKPTVARFLWNYRSDQYKSILRNVGIEEKESRPVIEMMEEKSAKRMASTPKVADEIARLVPDSLVDKIALAGTPEEIITKVEDFAGIGVKQIAILENRKETIERFAKDVITHFR
jgi:5,10-methylenetetrahydromethanopterin reductase